MNNALVRRRENAFKEKLESALDKGIRLEGPEAVADVLRELESALKLMPNSGPVLECCAMIQFHLGEKAIARLLYIRASRNQDGQVSEIANNVRNHFRTEFLKWSMYQPITGKRMEVTFEKQLLDLPRKFQRNSLPQVFKGTFHLLPTIRRAEDEIVLTMKLDHVEIGVSNFLSDPDFQGYFIHAFEIDISPTDLWKSRARLSTVKALDTHPPPYVQQQQTAGYRTQVGIGESFTPNINVQYSASEAISIFTPRVVFKASKDHEDENVMKCVWTVKTYDDGTSFVLGPVKKINKLPYPPERHEFSFPYEGTWVMPVSTGIELEYKFEWKIELKAKVALFERTLKRKLGLRKPRPRTCDFQSCSSDEVSDFAKAAMDKIFEP